MGRAIGGNAVIEERLRAAQGLSAFESHALAGFLDAEATFTICPNNGGSTWACAMSVCVRLDDGDVLADLCRSSGLGHVCARRAQRGSRPQACWQVASKRECLELARLLKRFPVTGSRASRLRDLVAGSRTLGGDCVRRASRPALSGRDALRCRQAPSSAALCEVASAGPRWPARARAGLRQARTAALGSRARRGRRRASDGVAHVPTAPRPRKRDERGRGRTCSAEGAHRGSPCLRRRMAS
ncbi:MAG: endonuclease [Solirubrobacteraceae bacterium]